MLRFFQLEANVAGVWEKVIGHVYATFDLHKMLEIFPLSEGQRLKRIPDTNADFMHTRNGGIVQWKS